MEQNLKSQNSLQTFLSRYKWLILILFILLVIAGLSIQLVIQQKQSKSIKASTAFEGYEEDYQNFISDYNLYKEHDSIDKEKMDTLVAGYTEITEKYPSGIFAQKSFIRIARMYVISKNYEEALKHFESAVKSGSVDYKSYLTSQALFNLASMQENTQKIEKAKASYQQLVDTYPQDLLAPHAVFNLARIHEQENSESIEESLGYYQLIISNEDWKESPWVSIAKSRLALLQKLEEKHNKITNEN